MAYWNVTFLEAPIILKVKTFEFLKEISNIEAPVAQTCKPSSSRALKVYLGYRASSRQDQGGELRPCL